MKELRKSWKRAKSAQELLAVVVDAKAPYHFIVLLQAICARRAAEQTAHLVSEQHASMVHQKLRSAIEFGFGGDREKSGFDVKPEYVSCVSVFANWDGAADYAMQSVFCVGFQPHENALKFAVTALVEEKATRWTDRVDLREKIERRMVSVTRRVMSRMMLPYLLAKTSQEGAAEEQQ
jgi:hypothetical protein